MPKTPDITTTNYTEPPRREYVLPIAPELLPGLLRGEKSTTYRFGDKYNYLEPGDVVEVTNSQTGTVVAQAAIISKIRTTFGALPLELTTHETYDSKEHQRQVFSSYYAYLGRAIQDNDPFLIIDYQLANEAARRTE